MRWFVVAALVACGTESAKPAVSGSAADGHPADALVALAPMPPDAGQRRPTVVEGSSGPVGPSMTPRAAETSVIAGVVTVTSAERDEGDLDADHVLPKVRGSYVRQVGRCYDDALKSNSGLKGRVDLLMWVGREGTVTKVQVDGFDAGLDKCITEKAMRWRFANPDKQEGVFAIGFRLHVK